MREEEAGASRPWLALPDGTPADVTSAFVDAMSASAGRPSPPLTMWWSLSRPDGGGIHLKVSDTGDGESKWVVTEVYVHGPEVTASTLQTTPLSQLVNMMNLFTDWDPWTIGEAANEDMGQRVLIDPPREPSLAALRKRAEHAPARLPSPRAIDRPKLTRPDGTDPDGFAARVAAAYREYATQTRAPAVEIAKEAAVPVATARSWVREARRRGKLPVGRKGKAG